MKRINVTKTFLPPVAEYQSYVESIWESGQLTNEGSLVKELESSLKEYLNVPYLQYVTNGTLALQLAMRTLADQEGEIITTPFSYVATTSAVMWEKFTPVFVDIEPDTLCIDATKIEAAITDKTRAIIPVHVFGNPCDVDAIEAIAKKHNLKVIYDAAHAFGVTYKGKSLFEFGDISTCSFHATKLFHTVEGGAVISSNNETDNQIDLMKRFGHDGDEHYMLGINAKASELHAAMGLVNLNYINDIIQQRRQKYELYMELLKDAKGLSFQSLRSGCDYNYAYFPVTFDSEDQRAQATKKMNDVNIYPRRYFYPSLNELPYLSHKTDCPISEDVSSRILCMPFYPDLSDDDIKVICKVLTN